MSIRISCSECGRIECPGAHDFGRSCWRKGGAIATPLTVERDEPEIVVGATPSAAKSGVPDVLKAPGLVESQRRIQQIEAQLTREALRHRNAELRAAFIAGCHFSNRGGPDVESAAHRLYPDPQ